jgi:hypothetical protein
MSPVTESEGSTPQIPKHSSWHNYSVSSIKNRIFLQAVSSGIGTEARNFKAEDAVTCCLLRATAHLRTRVGAMALEQVVRKFGSAPPTNHLTTASYLCITRIRLNTF